MANRYELRIRDAAGVEQARLGIGLPQPDGTVLRPFEYLKSVNAPGLLRLRPSGQHPILTWLTQNSQVEIWRSVDGGTWQQDFLGLVGGDYDYYYHAGQLDYTAYIPGALKILSWARVAWPAATSNRTQFTGVPAETITKTLVTYNATTAATTAAGRDLNWQCPFTVTVAADGAAGTTLDWACARQELLTTLQALAAGGGGDFDLIRDSSNPLAFEFRWYAGQRGTDRTATAIFSVARGTLDQVTFAQRHSHMPTAVIVAGRGEESNRDFVVRVTAGDGGITHYEQLLNATDVPQGATQTLNDRGDTYLATHQTQEEMSFVAVQSDGLRYGVDYFAGDLVTIVRPHDQVALTHKITGALVGMAADSTETISLRTQEQL